MKTQTRVLNVKKSTPILLALILTAIASIVTPVHASSNITIQAVSSGSNGGGSATSTTCSFTNYIAIGTVIVVEVGVISLNNAITINVPTDGVYTYHQQGSTVTAGTTADYSAAAAFAAFTNSASPFGDTITATWNSGPTVIACYLLVPASGSATAIYSGSKNLGTTTYSVLDSTGWTTGNPATALFMGAGYTAGGATNGCTTGGTSAISKWGWNNACYWNNVNVANYGSPWHPGYTTPYSVPYYSVIDLCITDNSVSHCT